MYTQQRYIIDDVERQWRSHNPTGKEKLSWPEYKDMVYGGATMEEQEAEKRESDKANISFSYLQMYKRDRRRWTTADLDGDDALTKQEFTAFLHAEDAEHMKDVIVLETMEDIDKDGDGKISLAEYIGKGIIVTVLKLKLKAVLELFICPQAICTGARKVKRSRNG